MRIGRRPDERHNAVILDLFGKLVTEDDRAQLLEAVQRDKVMDAILLQVEELRDLNDQGALTLRSLAQILTSQNKRLVFVRPRDRVLECLMKHSESFTKFEIVQNEPDAFKPREVI